MIINLTLQILDPKPSTLDDFTSALAEKEYVSLHTAADTHAAVIQGFHLTETIS